MRITVGSLLTMSLLLLLDAASLLAAEGPKTYPLWPDGAPGALGKDAGDQFHAGLLSGLPGLRLRADQVAERGGTADAKHDALVGRRDRQREGALASG